MEDRKLHGKTVHAATTETAGGSVSRGKLALRLLDR